MGRINSVEGRSVDDYLANTTLYESTALDPQPVMRLEHNPTEPTTRRIDILRRWDSVSAA